ncbi:hypothetical protein PV433_10865 [Paenibacillus sp. GYB004]|uniref:hypothetical protein n=1 Tax=Paenibacillus sp. GYB004 TaxID=2994393 RepID=UPI002F96CE87
MIWFLIGGVIVVALLVYAHLESSRAAYYRAKAREIQLRNEATTVQLTVKEEAKEVQKQDVLVDEESLPLFIQPRRGGVSQPIYKQDDDTVAKKNVSQDVPVKDDSMPLFIQRRIASNAQQYDERDAGMVISYHELESYQNYDDFLHLTSSDTSKAGSELEHEVDPTERAAALQTVELDHDALQYLKIIGVETECESEQHEIIESSFQRFELDESITMDVHVSPPELNLVQDHLPIEDPDDEAGPREVAEVTMYLGGEPRSGVQFIAGRIIEKFDDDLCRLDDGTGTKIISHHRLRHFELHDHVVCQVQVTNNGWNCLHVWGKFKEELQNVS